MLSVYKKVTKMYQLVLPYQPDIIFSIVMLFFQHDTTVTSIIVDETGEYVASCSDDGLVIISGLYSDENNQVLQVDQPVKVRSHVEVKQDSCI